MDGWAGALHSLPDISALRALVYSAFRQTIDVNSLTNTTVYHYSRLHSLLRVLVPLLFAAL